MRVPPSPPPPQPLLPVPLAPPCCPRPALSSAGTETRPATRDTALSRVPVPGGPFSALRVLEAPCPPHRVARVPTPVQLPSSQARAGGPPCVPTGDHLCCSQPRPHCVSARRFMWPVLPDAVACLCHPGWAHARHPHARTNPWATLRSQCSALSRKKSPVGPDCTSRESWLPGWGGRRGPAGGTSPWTQRDPGQCVRGRLPARSRETRREKEPASPGWGRPLQHPALGRRAVGVGGLTTGPSSVVIGVAEALAQGWLSFHSGLCG